jgi:hypothetical protein
MLPDFPHDTTVRRTTEPDRAPFFFFVAVAAILPPPAAAQRVLRIEGYWDRSEDTDQSLSGEIKFARSRSTMTRIFGVTMLRSYFPADTGMHLLGFRTSATQLNVNGPIDLVNEFFGVDKNRKVGVMGMYRGSQSTLTLSGLDYPKDGD